MSSAPAIDVSAARQPVRDAGVAGRSGRVDFPWAEFRSYPRLGCGAGVPLFHQGDAADHVCLVESGLVKLSQACDNGRVTIVALRGAPAMVGVDAALLGLPRTLTATPVRDSRVVRVPVDEFERRAWTNRKLAWFVMREQCLEQQRTYGRVAGFACLSARERLEAVVAQVAADVGARDGFLLPLRDWELAQLVGVTPQYLCVLVHELRDAGLLQRRGERWWVGRRRLQA